MGGRQGCALTHSHVLPLPRCATQRHVWELTGDAPAGPGLPLPVCPGHRSPRGHGSGRPCHLRGLAWPVAPLGREGGICSPSPLVSASDGKAHRGTQSPPGASPEPRFGCIGGGSRRPGSARRSDKAAVPTGLLTPPATSGPPGGRGRGPPLALGLRGSPCLVGPASVSGAPVGAGAWGPVPGLRSQEPRPPPLRQRWARLSRWSESPGPCGQAGRAPTPVRCRGLCQPQSKPRPLTTGARCRAGRPPAAPPGPPRG